jgi:hypothetical protein
MQTLSSLLNSLTPMIISVFAYLTVRGVSGLKYQEQPFEEGHFVMPYSEYRRLSTEEQDRLEADYTIALMKCWRTHSRGPHDDEKAH